MEENVDFYHIEAVKVVQRVTIHHVCETGERRQLFPCVHQKRACDVGHALDVAHVRSKYRERSKYVLKRLIKLLTFAKETDIDECPMQIFLNDLDIFLEANVILDVVGSKLDSDN